MNILPAKQEKTMKQIALKSFMQNNPFKHLKYMGIGCLIFFYSEFLTKLSLLKGSFFIFPCNHLTIISYFIPIT